MLRLDPDKTPSTGFELYQKQCQDPNIISGSGRIRFRNAVLDVKDTSPIFERSTCLAGSIFQNRLWTAYNWEEIVFLPWWLLTFLFLYLQDILFTPEKLEENPLLCKYSQRENFSLFKMYRRILNSRTTEYCNIPYIIGPPHSINIRW